MRLEIGSSGRQTVTKVVGRLRSAGFALLVLAILSGGATPVGAQSSAVSSLGVVTVAPGPVSVHRPTVAGLGFHNLSIDAFSFVPISSNTTYEFGSGSGRYITGGTSEPWFDATVDLPSGAVIDLVAFEINDTGTSDIYGFLIKCDGSSAFSGCAVVGTASTSGGRGQFYISTNSMSEVVDNFNNSYHVEVNAGTDTSGNVLFRRASVYYHLQVSPAPATQTFNDVAPADFGFQHIEALAASGITGGCGGGNFCPNNNVTRAQMAIFLAKALGLYFPN